MVLKIIMLSAYVGSILSFRTDSLILKRSCENFMSFESTISLFFTYEGRLISNAHSEISKKVTMYLNKRK